jgi:uncharacterized repeat protein (TIGR01451 family)
MEYPDPREDRMRKMMLIMAVIVAAVISAGGVAHAVPRDADPTRSPEAATADLKVTKRTPDANVSVGEDFTWTVRVTNRGQARAADVRLVDTLPVSVRLLNIIPSQGGPCEVDFPRVVCTLDTIGKGKTAVVKLRVEATQAGVLKNKARANTSTSETQLSDNRAVSVVTAS